MNSMPVLMMINSDTAIHKTQMRVRLPMYEYRNVCIEAYQAEQNHQEF